MHPYIPHLLADIAAAHRGEIPEEKFPQTFEEEMEAIENRVSGDEPEHTFGYYCGLDPKNFPLPEQLTGKDMKMIRKAFEQMMFTWNQGISLPQKLPVAFAYKMIMDSLNMKTSIENIGCSALIFQRLCPGLCF